MEQHSDSTRSDDPIMALCEGVLADASQRIGSVNVAESVVRYGRVIRLSGHLINVSGLPAPAGARCLIEGPDGEWLPAEVVGFDANALQLMPERGGRGIQRGARVRQDQAIQMPAVGWELLGRVIDGTGQPLDGMPLPTLTTRWPLLGRPINPMDRTPVSKPLDCGVRIINAMTTLGIGMRVGLFAGSGVGKSTLLGMMARHAQADVVVVGLIGERGREVGEFIEHSLGREALGRAVVVAAPADTSALTRLHAAHRANAIAEYFRSQGANVLLLVDSLTRLAMAEREIGLATGQPQAMRGYPPSTFSLIASYLERAGHGGPGEGSITGIYTVLVEGDDTIADPVADTARATLDGHIVLRRNLAESGLYPPVDIEASLSRVMNGIVSPEHRQASLRLRALWSRLQEKRDLLDIGAYQPGADPLLDEAVGKRPIMEALLKQQLKEGHNLEDSLVMLKQVIASTPSDRGQV